MGGFGSGRAEGADRKTNTTELLQLDVRVLAGSVDFRSACVGTCTWTANGEIVGSVSMKVGEGGVVFDYRLLIPGEEAREVSSPVRMAWSRCALGGYRPWFRCPGSDCGRRVAILYCGSRLLCRQCLRLVYPSQRESVPKRAYRRATGLLRRLTGPIHEGDAWPRLERPKGMHRHTFNRLLAQHARWMDIYFAEETKRMEAMLGYIRLMERRLT